MQSTELYNAYRHSLRAGALLAAAALLALAGCASAPPPKPVVKELGAAPPPENPPPVPARNEIALENGTQVVANTPAGKITIAAGPGLLRTYTWGGETRWVVLEPRAERWAGSLGLFYEGTPSHWRPYQGMVRVELEEGQQHFENLSDANIWMQIRRLHFVHTSNGLVVGWRRLPQEGTLQVEVWQFFIGGEKPAYMPGSKDYLIQIRQAPVKAAQASANDV